MRFLRLITLMLLAANLAVLVTVARPFDQETTARKLINSQGCKACHPLEEAGGNAAPDLKEAGQRLSTEAIRKQLDNSEHRHGDGRIPDFHHLKSAEIDAIVWFLQQPAASPSP